MLNDDQLIRFVTHQLDASAKAIGQVPRDRLKFSRQTAILHQRRSGEASFANVGELINWDLYARRTLMKSAALLIITFGFAYWHATDYIVALEELDSAILTDEMPMDVITDKGFDAWLKSSDAH